MDFDFYTQFQDKSTAELLLILKEPAKYQPAAIEAAGKILSERTVTEQDEQQAAAFIEQRLLSKMKKKHSEKSLSELLDPLTNPQRQSNLEKAINIGLGVMTVYYAWSAYQQVRYLWQIGECSECKVDFTLGLSLLYLVYSILACILLWKRHPWGWRLLFAENVISVAQLTASIVLFSRLSYTDYTSTIIFLVIGLLRLTVVVLTWRLDVAAHFSITPVARKKTLIWALIIAGVLFALMTMSWYW